MPPVTYHRVPPSLTFTEPYRNHIAMLEGQRDTLKAKVALLEEQVRVQAATIRDDARAESEAIADALCDLRSPCLGDWDEWTKTALGGYNGLTVYARSALAHLHGMHAAGSYMYCPICEAAERATRAPDGSVTIESGADSDVCARAFGDPE